MSRSPDHPITRSPDSGLRCPYPNCVSDQDHDGDHVFERPPRPRGHLRLVQTFSGGPLNPPCDLHNIPSVAKATPAIALYMDELRFGWQLCQACSFTLAPEYFHEQLQKEAKLETPSQTKDREGAGKTAGAPPAPGSQDPPPESRVKCHPESRLQPGEGSAPQSTVSTQSTPKRAKILDFAARERGVR